MGLPPTISELGGYFLTIRQHKAISNDSHGTREFVPAVDLVRQAGGGPEVLEVSVQRVDEVQVLVDRVDGGVVQGAELAAEVVVDQDGRVVRLDGVHEDDVGRVVGPGALGHVDDLAAVVCGPVGVDHGRVGRNHVHGDLLGAVGLALDGIGLGEGDLLDDGRLVEAGPGVYGPRVLDEEDLIGGLIPVWEEIVVSLQPSSVAVAAWL